MSDKDQPKPKPLSKEKLREVEWGLTRTVLFFLAVGSLSLIMPAAGPAVFLGLSLLQLGAIGSSVLVSGLLLGMVGYASNAFGIRDFFKKAYNSLFGTAPTITKHASLPESLVPVEDTASLALRKQDTYKKVVSLPVTEPGYVKVGFTPDTAATYGKVYIAPKDAQFRIIKGYMQDKQFIAEANQNEGQAHLLMKLANGKIFDVRQFLDEPMVIASATGLEFSTTKENKLTKLTPGQVFVIEKDVFGVAQIMIGKMVQAHGNVETKALETSERVNLLTNKVSLSSAAPSKLPSSLLEIKPTADLQLCAGK